jgi:alpha-ketoglutarate-dependent taurine dioxygenase
MADTLVPVEIRPLTRHIGAEIVGLDLKEFGEPRYETLHAACRYRWTEGTFAMWDNRCTLHRVASDFVGERVIQRVTIAGDKPIAARGQHDSG